jgi:hypothetical protein
MCWADKFRLIPEPGSTVSLPQQLRLFHDPECQCGAWPQKERNSAFLFCVSQGQATRIFNREEREGRGVNQGAVLEGSIGSALGRFGLKAGYNACFLGMTHT